MDSFTQSPLLEALGWALFDSLWQMALLWLSYILLVSVFTKMASHRRHGLAVCLVCAGTVSAIFSFVHYLTADGASSGEWLNPLLQKLQYPRYANPATIGQWMGQLLPYCSFAYLLALVWLFIRYSNHYLYSRRLKGKGLSRMEPALRVFVAQTARRLGIKRTVGVWLSSMVEGPVTLGCMRPVILVPLAMVNNMSLQQVEAILLHELAHIKRYDYLLNLAVTIVQLVFFFNPFARLLIRNIRKEREHRCDDLVIQFRYDPHAYASALLSLAAIGGVRQKLALAATGRNDRLLLQRVKRILKQDKVGDRPGRRPVLIFLFTILATLITLSHRPVVPARAAVSPRMALAPLSGMAVPPPTRIAAPVNGKSPRRHIASPGKRVVTKTDLGINIPVPRAGEKEYPYEYSVGPMPRAVNISISHIDLDRPVQSKTEQMLTAALTDPNSSASEVKARILKALAANESGLKKNREALDAFLKAIGDLPSAAVQQQSGAARQTGGDLQRRLLQEKAQYEQQEIILQQELNILLERAARKLSIVYI
jgi:beta-lactamase regulating signal transducer with metallopeptidase domain